MMQIDKLRLPLAAPLIALLCACGGAGDVDSDRVHASIKASVVGSVVPAFSPGTPEQASRFLGQASFGPTLADIGSLTTRGFDAWFDGQFDQTQSLHKTYIDNVIFGLPASRLPNPQDFYASFWQQAATGHDQLRQRVAFALSQLFVTSFTSPNHSISPRGMGCYYDTLANGAFGNFRTLLQDVTLHPVMGMYLNTMRNQKESGTRIADQNYAREVMQLFTIGLVQLNLDGSPQLNGGKPIATYGSNDVLGLSRVFTGWSWGGAGMDRNTPGSVGLFFGSLWGDKGGNVGIDAECAPMAAYPDFHSVSEKQFLGVTIPAGAANPQADLKLALDTLFNHPNVGPFIGKQLIQRLVTSNPSPQYVRRVAAAFNGNGAPRGVRGDMKTVIKAILMDPEARADVRLSNPNIGKVREPVLRLGNLLRSFNASPDPVTQRFNIGNTDDPLFTLAQTPMNSQTVFNFYRPGFVPPGTSVGKAGMVAPELQIVGQTTVVGYLNYLHAAVQGGQGAVPNYAGAGANIPSEAALAFADPAALLARVNLLLMAGQMSPALQAQILDALNASPVAGRATLTTAQRAAIQAGTTALTPTQIAAATPLVELAVYLTMASPEYIVQK